MGVDYRATSGYGFAIPEAETEALAEKLGYEGSEWGFDSWEFGEWLVENSSILSSDHVGNLMGGEEIYLLITASSSTTSLDFYYDSGLVKYGEFEISDRVQQELEELYDKLYGEGAHKNAYIGWMLAMTVS